MTIIYLIGSIASIISSLFTFYLIFKKIKTPFHNFICVGNLSVYMVMMILYILDIFSVNKLDVIFLNSVVIYYIIGFWIHDLISRKEIKRLISKNIELFDLLEKIQKQMEEHRFELKDLNDNYDLVRKSTIKIVEFGEIGKFVYEIRCIEECEKLYEIIIFENDIGVSILRNSDKAICDSLIEGIKMG